MTNTLYNSLLQYLQIFFVNLCRRACNFWEDLRQFDVQEQNIHNQLSIFGLVTSL